MTALTTSVSGIGATAQAARDASVDWAALPLRDRVAIVCRLRHVLAERSGDFIAAIRSCKPHPDLELICGELIPLADACAYLEKNAAKILRPRRLGWAGRPMWLSGVRAEIRREPLGQVLIIGPGNYPLMIPGIQIVQALVAGNRVLFKPAPGTSQVARLLCDSLHRLGVPGDALVLLGESPAAAGPWLARVDKVFMTGSENSGKAVLRALAEQVVPSVMELSGCDAVFVIPGADLDRVVDAVRFGLTFNASATCMAPRRLIVHETVADALAQKLAAGVRGCQPRPVSPGPIRLLDQLGREAMGEGAVLLSGTLPFDPSAGPVILDRTIPAMSLLQQDVMAPVLSLIRVESDEQAQAVYEACAYRLGASVFGPESAAGAMAGRIRAGSVCVNDLIVPTADPRLPLCPQGRSGFGATRGAEGLLEMTRVKTVSFRSGRPMHLRPHADEAGPLLLAYLQAAHGPRWLDRLRSWMLLAREGRRLWRRGRRSTTRIMSNHRNRPHFTVIGGGLGGLAAACTLAARGHAVSLLERNAWLGGKAAVLESNGFRFDMGPTILTLPSVLRRIFAEAGRDMDAEVPLIHLDPQWRCFFNDGSRLDLTKDIAAMAAALDDYAPGTESGNGYRRFIDFSRRLHDISNRYFFWRSIGGMGDMFQPRDSAKSSTLSDVLALQMGRSVASTIRACTPDGRVAQMLDHFTQYVGSDPGKSPAVLAGIAHMQTDEGIWYPRGGTASVPRALARLAAELGVDIRTGAQVKQIRTASGKVTGVELESGEMIASDAVVSNMDAVRTHTQLLGGAVARRFSRRRRYEPACSGVVLYLGLSKRYDHLLHHNFVFSRDPDEEFRAIYDAGIPAPDPTCYVCAPACTEPDVAPPGGEALYVLVHGPYLRPGHDWRMLLPEYREVILNKLARTAGMTDLRDRIVFQSALTPSDIDQRYQVLQGAIYGLASHGRFVGAFKPGNRSRLVKGLYLAGGAAHPGPGMPMVLMSGWIAADAADQDLRRGTDSALQAPASRESESRAQVELLGTGEK